MGAYIVKVTMKGFKPPMWRRIQIPDHITFENFHSILQTCFGWEDYHLHLFLTPFGTIGPNGQYDDNDIDESELIIDDCLAKMSYIYDFGDNWEHQIVFEKYDPTITDRFAKVIKWKGDNFNEDIGGVYSAMMMLEEEKYRDMTEDEDEDEDEDDYDEEWSATHPFDLDYVNHLLHSLKFPVSESTFEEDDDEDDFF